MGCKLSVSVVHPESIVNKIKETMSPTSKRSRKISEPNIKVSPEPESESETETPRSTTGPRSTTDNDDPPSSPDSIDIYKTIYLDSP